MSAQGVPTSLLDTRCYDVEHAQRDWGGVKQHTYYTAQLNGHLLQGRSNHFLKDGGSLPLPRQLFPSSLLFPTVHLFPLLLFPFSLPFLVHFFPLKYS